MNCYAVECHFEVREYKTLTYPVVTSTKPHEYYICNALFRNIPFQIISCGKILILSDGQLFCLKHVNVLEH